MDGVGGFHHLCDVRDRPPDFAIARLAHRQHGVVARRQLAALGLGRGSIEHRLTAGRLHLVHRGVYAVGHSRLTGRGRWMAAVLAVGDDALLSHRSAAALWELVPSAGARVDVATAMRTRSGRPGIALHRVRRLGPGDHDRRDGIPVTTVARTLLDLAEVVSKSRLERAFEEADRMEVLDVAALIALIDRSPGRQGLRQLRALVEVQRPQPSQTRSELERAFLVLCRDAGLPTPAVNALVAGFEVDGVWRREGLVVELDGYAFHRTRAAFERDRARDAALLVRGYRVLRVTARRLAAEPAEVTSAIRLLLAGPAPATTPPGTPTRLPSPPQAPKPIRSRRR